MMKEGHTLHRYDGELHNLHVLSLEMGGLVLDQTRHALRAFAPRGREAAERVMHRERDVDELERRIDDEIISVIARRAPVASDLRATMATSKMVTDLERIGDEAAKLAATALSLYAVEAHEPGIHLLRDLHAMGEVSTAMLEEALMVLDTLDSERAALLTAASRRDDAELEAALRRLVTFVFEDSRQVGQVIAVVLALRALERIGDHSRNLAEHVIYLVRGEDVRHRFVRP